MSTADTVRATSVVMALLLTGYALFLFRNVMLGVFIGLLLAAAVRPLVDFLERRGVGRQFGALLVFFVLSTLAVGFCIGVLPVMIERIAVLADKLPEYYQAARLELAESASRTIRRLAWNLPKRPPAFFDGGAYTVPELLTYVEIAGSALIMSVAVLLFGFYWTIDSAFTERVFLRAVRRSRRSELRALARSMSLRLGAFIRGQLALCGAVGVLAFISYWIIGLPHAAVLALAAAVLEAVPLIGPVLGAVPALLIALAVDPMLAVWVAVASVLIQVGENYFLSPRVMGHSVGLHPLSCLLSLLILGTLLGVAGALIAIPIAAVLQVFFEKYLVDREAEPQDPTPVPELSGPAPFDWRRFAFLTAAALGTALAVVIAWQARSAFMLLFLAIATTNSAHPIVHRLTTSLRASRGVAIGITYALFLTGLSVIAYFVVVEIFTEVQIGIDRFFVFYAQLVADWKQSGGMQQFFAERMPPVAAFHHAVDSKNLGSVAEGAVLATVSLASFFGQIVMVLVLAVYWAIYRDEVLSFWLQFLERRNRLKARELWQKTFQNAGAEARFEVVQFMLVLCVSGGAFAAIGMTYWALAGTTVALARLFPFIGIIFGAPMAFLLGLEAGLPIALAAGAIAAVVLLGVRALLSRALGYTRQVSPILVLVTVMLLASAYGIIGILAAPLLAVILSVHVRGLGDESDEQVRKESR